MNIYHVTRIDDKRMPYDEIRGEVLFARSPQRARELFFLDLSESDRTYYEDKIDILYLGKGRYGAKEGSILVDFLEA